MSRTQTCRSVTACLVPHTVIPLLHNLQLTHFHVTHMLRPVPHAFHAQLNVSDSSLWVKLTPSSLRRFSPKYLGYFSCVIFVALGRTGQMETQTHDITFYYQSCETKYQNNSRMEERASSVNIFADYGWHFLKSGTVWFHRATDGTASVTFTCSRRLFNIASSSMFTRCFVITDGGTVKHVNESISRRGRAACHMIHGGKKVWKQNEREQKKMSAMGGTSE